MFLVNYFPLVCLPCLSRTSLLGYFLTVCFIFTDLELPSGFFSVYNACCYSVVNYILFAGVIYAMF